LKENKNSITDEQSIFSRKVYTVHAKKELLQHLEKIAEPQSVDLFRDTTVIMTDDVDFERHIEGWGIKLTKAAKETFVENLFGEFSPFVDEHELFNVLGETTSYVELFDRWFTIAEVEYLKISKDWKNV
jgi:hypothetical protein